MQKTARLLGREYDAKAFEEEMRLSQSMVHEAWFNPKENTYANGEQPYLIFPLLTGITPESLRETLFHKYVETLVEKDKGHLNTGMIGTQIMTDYLIETDRNDLIDMYVNKKTYPGWGYMVENDATTCWEQWNGYFSQIHSCFPYIGGWFYRGLAGIQWDPEIPGFKNIILRPSLVKSVDWVKCSYESPYGKIVSNWKLKEGLFSWDISIPPNTTATIHLPGDHIKENGVKADNCEGVHFIKFEEGKSILMVQPGNYNFTSNLIDLKR
jgi:alpha-L-rhamnosidase